MKYRIIGLAIAVVILVISSVFIMPRLDLENTWVNFIFVAVVFGLIATLATIAKKLDKR